MTDTDTTPKVVRDDSHWGSIDSILAELQAMTNVLEQAPTDPIALRAFTRWFWSALDTLAFALKSIAYDYAMSTGVDLTKREAEVLHLVEEPSFPGFPPPRRVEFSVRETLNTAVRVFARCRKSQSAPLSNDALPPAFVAGSVVVDKVLRPHSGSQLDLTREDAVVLLQFFAWFQELQQWLYRERRAWLEEVREHARISTAALMAKLRGEES